LEIKQAKKEKNLTFPQTHLPFSATEKQEHSIHFKLVAY
jgi:hypothetical protein